MTDEETLINVDSLSDENEDPKRNNLKLYKIIRQVMDACSHNSLKKMNNLISGHKEYLQDVKLLLDSGKVSRLNTPEFENRVRNVLFQKFSELCQNDDDLLFFTAAAFNSNQLEKLCAVCNLNQTRYSQTVLVFALKYGNIAHENFLKCMKILIDAGVDVNRFDNNGNSAIDNISFLHGKNENNKEIQENLEKLAEMLLDKGLSAIENTNTKKFVQETLRKDLSTYSFVQMDEITTLFYWLAKEKSREVLNFKKIDQFVNCDDGENTLLQTASKKSEKSVAIVDYFLKNGADPNKTTPLNPLTPLELAALNKHLTIFKKILDHPKTKITKNSFDNLVKWRWSRVTFKCFELLLESDKLDANFVYQKSGNTPLHYAIRFSHKNAIQKILKRPRVSLITANKSGRTPLEMIDADDLETYFDSCLVLDRYAPDSKSNDYKMQLRFKSLITVDNEAEIISKIAQNSNLEHLLTHPLLHTFIELKWFKIATYYWIVLIAQALIFLGLSISFYLLSDNYSGALPFCVIFFLINLITKLIFLIRGVKTIRDLKPTTPHEYGEILLIVSLLLSFAFVDFCGYSFISMSIIFLLTAGYHPKLAKWSVMLQKVFKSFTLLLLLFSLMMIAFAAAFHVVFREKHEFFESFWKSIFITYVMTTGELNTHETDFGSGNFFTYFLFLLFTMCISIVIINFLTGVAVTDIDRIERRAEMNAFKNIIIFLLFIQKHIYRNKRLRKFLPDPLLFSENDQSYAVDFYINKENQFDGSKIFPARLHKNCVDKIKSVNFKQTNSSNEKNVLMKLEEISKILNELKAARCVSCNKTTEESKQISNKLQRKKHQN